MVHPRCLQMLLKAQKITVPTKHTSRWYIEDLSDMDEESIFHIKKERLMCLDCPQISLEDVNRNIEISMKILEGAH
jgi:cytochrome c-type biogenesis protein CcmH/NrfF